MKTRKTDALGLALLLQIFVGLAAVSAAQSNSERGPLSSHRFGLSVRKSCGR
jgi:hypothetical protein